MRELYPSSAGRYAGYLEGILNELVPDATQTGMGSRHFHAYNPMALELDRTTGLLRRADTRPWKADVRQAGSVEAAEQSSEEKDEAELVFGKPDEIELRELRRYPHEGKFMGEDGSLADNLRVIENDGELRINAEGRLHRLTENGQSRPMEAESVADPWQLVSPAPQEQQFVSAPGVLSREVGAQRRGLDIIFAGRGKHKLEVRFTGQVVIHADDIGESSDDVTNIVSVSNGIEITLNWNAVSVNGYDVSAYTNLVEGLKMYNQKNELQNYAINEDTVMIFNVESEDYFTLYYRGMLHAEVDSRGSARVDQVPQHSISLEPIANRLVELPDGDDITCIERTNHIAELPMQGGTIGVTEQGYVGTTDLGHKIHHVLPGPRHVLAVGDGTLSICEPESTKTWKFSVPDTSVGLTWTDEGLLGLITNTGDEFVVHALNERRRGKTGGFTTNPPLQ